jgi:hypothetical protein
MIEKIVHTTSRQVEVLVPGHFVRRGVQFCYRQNEILFYTESRHFFKSGSEAHA